MMGSDDHSHGRVKELDQVAGVLVVVARYKIFKSYMVVRKRTDADFSD